MIKKRPSILLVIAMLLVFFSVGFSVTEQGIHLFWEKYPIIATLMVMTATLLFFWWYKLDTQKKEARIMALQAQLTSQAAQNKLLEKLTLKEEQILALIAEGKSNKEIAQAQFVEVSTIKTHINNLYKKLGISHRKEARLLGKQLTKK